MTVGDAAEPANEQKRLDTESQIANRRPPVIRPQAAPTRYWTKEFWLAVLGRDQCDRPRWHRGADFTYQSNRDLSSEEFQRTERRNAYVELNGKAKNLEDAEIRVNTQDFRTRPDFDLTDPAAAENAKRRLEELDRRVAETTKEDAVRSQFISAAAEVDLVGSGKALIAMIKLREAHSDVEFAYDDIVKTNLEWTLAPNKDDPKNLRKVDDAIKTYDEKRLATSTARSEFVNAARGDLGIGYDLQWSSRTMVERRIILGALIAVFVWSTINAIRSFNRRSFANYLALSVAAVCTLLLYSGQTLWLIVVAGVSVGCAPFVQRQAKRWSSHPGGPVE